MAGSSTSAVRAFPGRSRSYLIVVLADHYRRTWYPEGLRLIGGKGAKNEPLKFELRHNLGDKTIADVCEAMIGAAFVTHFTSGNGDSSQMDEAVKATSAFVCSKDHDMQTWDDYQRNYVVPAYQTGESSASQRDLAERVKQSHNYSFKYPRLLRSAFLHPSVPKVWEGLPSYRKSISPTLFPSAY